MRRRLLLRLAASAHAGLPTRAAEDSHVVYPRHLPQQERQVNCFVTLMQLALALARSSLHDTPQAKASSMVQGHALIELVGERPNVNVFWTLISHTRE